MSKSARAWRSWSWILLMAGVGPVAAKESKTAALTHEHLHPTAGFAFRTPEEWVVTELAGRPGAIEAAAGALRVRFVWQKGEQGYDAAHVLCMLERLVPAMESEPQMRYEYDFISGAVGERRFLDSAFEIRYDQPVMGQRDWRQRALTIVGEGETLCVVSAAPSAAWRKAGTRALLDGILTSLKFPQAPSSAH